MAKHKLTRNQTAALIGVVAGLILLLAGVNGATAWGSIIKYLESKVGTDAVINAIAFVIVTIASLGGLAVILGSLLFTTKHVKAGRLLIAFGAGLGLIGLIIFIAVNLEKAETAFLSSIGLGFVGIVLSIVARLRSEAPPKSK